MSRAHVEIPERCEALSYLQGFAISLRRHACTVSPPVQNPVTDSDNLQKR